MNQSNTPTNCIFCKIIAGYVPAKIIAQNDTCIAIEDIAPKVPLHYLIMPKEHRESIKDLTATDTQIAADLLLLAQHISREVTGAQEFKLVSNNGKQAGQIVFHLHIHFLAGKLQKSEV